jgi:hypothetical protein
MGDAILAVLLVGLCWWLWAKNRRWNRDEEKRRDEEAKIIAACESGLTHEEVAAMFGAKTERVRTLMILRDD